MKTRINLYLPEYQPKLQLMTLNAMLTLFVFLILLVIAARVYLTLNGNAIEAELTNLRSQIEQQSNFSTELTNQLQQRKEDPQLLAMFASLQSSLQDKERIKSALRDRESLKSASFAQLLRELSQQYDQSLWLTRISVDESSMVFNGEAIRPEAVPQWVTRLGNTEFFSGKSFDEARLIREDSALRFSLETSRDDQSEDNTNGGASVR